jgi:hypothetical protein
MDIWTYGQMDSWTAGQMDGQTVRNVGRQLGGWPIERETDKSIGLMKYIENVQDLRLFCQNQFSEKSRVIKVAKNNPKGQ